MSKKICFNIEYLYIIIFILACYSVFHFSLNNKFNEFIKRIDIESNKENNEDSIENEMIENYNTIVSLRPDNRKIKSLDRIYNPLEYHFQSSPYYNNTWYESYLLPENVMECGGRRQPCYGGSQEVIPNMYPNRIINNNNIAPINIKTRGPEGEPQQVGTLFNLSSGNKDVLPLFGRRKYPNDDKWEYYTIIGQFGSKVPVKPLRNYQEIGTNDILQLVNYPGNFQATIYKRDDIQYIPYI